MARNKNKNKERKKKVTLVFDESKRKEFLCGFRKRKLERKKKAQEELQRMLKEEKKRIKQENKEAYKKLVVSSRPIPDIEQLLQEEYEDNDVNVKIVELSSDTLQKRDLVIGENKPKEISIKKVVPKQKNKSDQTIPGMASDGDSVSEESEPEDNGDDKLKTKKEIKRFLKERATKQIKKSKVFQMNSKLQRVQNKKQARKQKNHVRNNKNQSRKNTSMKKVGKKKH